MPRSPRDSRGCLGRIGGAGSPTDGPNSAKSDVDAVAIRQYRWKELRRSMAHEPFWAQVFYDCKPDHGGGCEGIPIDKAHS
jgi:hypothetical protein